MKKLIITGIALLVSLNSMAQIIFEKGYFIDNNDQKTECLIKNADWKNNPIAFEYKITAAAEKQKASITEVKEFGIYEVAKYERHTVQIDRSSKIVEFMSKVSTPEFKEEQLFLRVLMEGQTDLFIYKYGNLIRFFFSRDDSNPEQLVYKKYINASRKIAENRTFRTQLWDNFRCPDFLVTDIGKVDYNKKDLVKYFTKYYECQDQPFTFYNTSPKRDLFNFALRIGINQISSSIGNSLLSINDADFENKIGGRFSIETEFIMPYNKNKWALVVEPTYQIHKAQSTNESMTNGITIDYRSIELPIGIRYYLFLNEQTKLFVNGSFVIDIVDDQSRVNFERGEPLELKSSNNLAFGAGLKWKDKFSAELRYQTNRELLQNYFFWSSDYRVLSLVVGYTLF
ncbi:MAG: tRNA modification GTPase [Bacteroidota bacterium]